MPATPIAALDVEIGQQSRCERGSGVELSGRGRVGVKEALGQPHRADVEARPPLAEDQLGRAAADVDDERGGVERTDAAPGQVGLLVAGEQPGREAEPRPDLGQELGSVRGIACGARRHRERSLRAERLELVPVARDRRQGARDRLGLKPPRRVDALAEPRHDGAAEHIVDPRSLDVGDEQPRRVGADIDRGDARHLPGMYLRTRRYEAYTSPAAPARTPAVRERLLQVRLGALEPGDALVDAGGAHLHLADRLGDPEHGDLGRAPEPAEGAPGAQPLQRRHCEATEDRDAEHDQRDEDDVAHGAIVVALDFPAVRALASRRDGLVQLGIVLAAVGAYEAMRLALRPDWPLALEHARRIAAFERVAHLAWEAPAPARGSERAAARPGDERLLSRRALPRDGAVLRLALPALASRLSLLPQRLHGRDRACAGRRVAVPDGATARGRARPRGHAPALLRHRYRLARAPPASPTRSPPCRRSMPAGPSAVGAGLVLYARPVAVRLLAPLYPAAVVLTILATGNHFVVDALAGVLVMALGFGARRASGGRRGW